jgi:hypothetical protein
MDQRPMIVRIQSKNQSRIEHRTRAEWPRYAAPAQSLDDLPSLYSGLLSKPRKQAIVEFALRQQLATLAQKGRKPRISPSDRAFWVFLSRT